MGNDADSSEEQTDFFEKNKLSTVIFLSGLILVGLGILGLKFFNFSSEPKVEILGEQTSENTLGTDTTIKAKIVVEISGEVLKPGVYEFSEGNRVNDLLTAAGGLSGNADREWVAKNINLAQKLTDGAKIYIPIIIQKSNIKNQNQDENLKADENKININSASISELDTLWGVGEATAKKIIAGRPYLKIEDLLEKKIVNQSVFDKNKDKIVLY